MSDWRTYEHGPRRPAKDGIPARSRRGEIGESWWSKRFLDALKAVADTSRLGRGRSYARTGQVMDLRGHPGRVTARGQGSRSPPHPLRAGPTPLTHAPGARAREGAAGPAPLPR